MRRSPIRSRPRRKPLKRAGETDAAAIMRDARAAALERDGYECQAPGRGMEQACLGKLHAHHMLPRGRGGQDHPANLVTLCGFHHAMVHQFPERSYRLGLLRRSSTIDCAGCGHPESWHVGAVCTAPPYGMGCPCQHFEEAA